jgi:ATP-dependent helicase YprA (DUF1998 family)
VVAAVRRDVEDGTWDRRHGTLRALDAFDAGLRLVRTCRRRHGCPSVTARWSYG